MAHPWHDVALPPVAKLGEGFPVIVEIPKGSKNKYELDKETGLLKVDRVLFSAVHYPANYGFVPRTLEEDGDPIDVLVLGQEPIVPLALVWSRAIGSVEMRDEHGVDTKIIAVHVHDPAVRDYQELDDLPQHVMLEIRRFFEDYKVLEGKPVAVGADLDRHKTLELLKNAIECYAREHK
ncbi:MAG TPA: inorganic diphosphatase [Polyangia bacterium]|nr:inorganic diphosphatase [Polyangia bacterium]